MATHSSVLAWRIPGTGEPGGLPSMGVTQSRLKRLSSSSSLKSLQLPMWSLYQSTSITCELIANAESLATLQTY